MFCWSIIKWSGIKSSWWTLNYLSRFCHFDRNLRHYFDCHKYNWLWYCIYHSQNNCVNYDHNGKTLMTTLMSTMKIWYRSLYTWQGFLWMRRYDNWSKIFFYTYLIPKLSTDPTKTGHNFRKQSTLKINFIKKCQE